MWARNKSRTARLHRGQLHSDLQRSNSPRLVLGRHEIDISGFLGTALTVDRQTMGRGDKEPFTNQRCGTGSPATIGENHVKLAGSIVWINRRGLGINTGIGASQFVARNGYRGVRQ